MQISTQLQIGAIILLVLWIWLLLYKTETAVRILFGAGKVLWVLLEGIARILYGIFNWVLNLFTRRRR